MHVDRVVAGFRNAPGDAALLAILDLPVHYRLIGLVEQRVCVGGHHQQRHEVLEHRAAPRQERRLAPGDDQQASQGKPAFLRQLALRNRHKTGQARFRSQQVVVARIPPPLADVVANRQQMTRLVEQEVVVHLGQFAGLQRQEFERGDSLAGAAAGVLKERTQHRERFALLGGGR